MERNWALKEQGADVAEVSHEAIHIASGASNLLVDREDLLWITGDAPQHVTLQLQNDHAPIRYVGWNVWHDYLTNPKNVEVSSGPSLIDLAPVLVCEAVPGAGRQLWKLPYHIPSQHRWVRFSILETFGPGPTYMNNLFLFSNDPGQRFYNTVVSTSKTTATTSQVALNSSASHSLQPHEESTVSGLLKELDEDIRRLKPIHTVEASKNMLQYVSQGATNVAFRPLGDHTAEDDVDSEGLGARQSHMLPVPNGAMYPGDVALQPRAPAGEALPSHMSAGGAGMGMPAHGGDLPKSFNDRLCNLEQAVASLTQSLTHQREDLTMIKRLLLQQATERRRAQERPAAEATSKSLSIAPVARQDGLLAGLNPSQFTGFSSQQVSVEFPEDALRSFVEQVMSAQLTRLTKKTEARTMKRLDHYLREVVNELSQSVDERVKRNLAEQLHSRR